MKKKLAGVASILFLSACAVMDEGPVATASLRPASGREAHGQLKFTQVGPDRVRITGWINAHHPGPRGFHIHEKGDCSAYDAMSAGGHFNPAKTKHGGSPASGHAGDLGNLTFDDFGRTKLDRVVDGLSVSRDAPNGIIGRAVVLHMEPDDLKTDPTGNAGGRAACGVIG